MLPRLMQWLDQAVAGPGAARRADGDEDAPESLMSDDTLSVSESTITEYSRAIAAYDDAGHTMACNMMDESALEGVQAFIDKRKPDWA